VRNLIRLEELFLFLLSILLFTQTRFAWWWYPVLLFSPDLAMIGYIAGARTGAITYNLVHHKAVAISAYILGVLMGITALQLAGVILLGHTSLDRVLGYGLKYTDSFQHTHLGSIGATARQ
jgi:hypothetical protein